LNLQAGNHIGEDGVVVKADKVGGGAAPVHQVGDALVKIASGAGLPVEIGDDHVELAFRFEAIGAVEKRVEVVVGKGRIVGVRIGGREGSAIEGAVANAD